MAQKQKVSLSVPPGVIKVDAPYAVEGRYIDSNLMRLSKGLYETLGGWTKWITDTVTGTPRTLFSWNDQNITNYVAAGTECNLEVSVDGRNWLNITPLEESGTLGTDPFAVTNSSPTITVTTVVDHLRAVGDHISFEGATDVGGLAIDGNYTVTSVIDSTSFTITHTSNATSTATGGGSTVVYGWQIPCGSLDVEEKQGWGVGQWGIEAWGEPRTIAALLQYPHIWALDNYGSDLLAAPFEGALYRWSPIGGARPVLVAGAPSGISYMFVTEERFVFILGYDDFPMTVAWPDQDDITDFVPSETNTANIRTLRGGNRLVAGAALAHKIALVWSDTSCFLFQFTGLNAVYNSRKLGDNCGLIGPGAFQTDANGVAYWMSRDDFHMSTGGRVSSIPNADDIKQWVLDQLDSLQNWKVTCAYVSQFNEMWWFYVPAGQTEPTKYVKCNIAENYAWDVGDMTRTAFALRQASVDEYLLASTDSYVYQHENGVDADGVAMNSYIEAAPQDIGDGEVSMNIWGLIPNFNDRAGDISFELTTRDYPEEAAAKETITKTIAPGETQTDFTAHGRQAGYKFTSNVVGGKFRLGKPRLEISTAGGRR